MHAGHQLTANVKLLQKAVLICDKKVLILQRSGDSKSRPLCWDLPGGNSEWPKEVTQNQQNLHTHDIAREILEETGIVVPAEHFTQDNLQFFETFFEASKGIYSIITGWKVALPNAFNTQSVILSSEHIAFAWITLSELESYDFGGHKGVFITKMIRAV